MDKKIIGDCRNRATEILHKILKHEAHHPSSTGTPPYGFTHALSVINNNKSLGNPWDANNLFEEPIVGNTHLVFPIKHTLRHERGWEDPNVLSIRFEDLRLNPIDGKKIKRHGAKYGNETKEAILSSTLTNNQKTEKLQQEIEYQKTIETNYSNAISAAIESYFSLKIGGEASFASAEFGLKVSVGYEHTSGGSVTKTETGTTTVIASPMTRVDLFTEKTRVDVSEKVEIPVQYDAKIIVTSGHEYQEAFNSFTELQDCLKGDGSDDELLGKYFRDKPLSKRHIADCIGNRLLIHKTTLHYNNVSRNNIRTTETPLN